MWGLRLRNRLLRSLRYLAIGHVSIRFRNVGSSRSSPLFVTLADSFAGPVAKPSHHHTMIANDAVDLRGC